jgi:hypothetical protein
MQDRLNSVTNLVCSVGYEASTANQRKQLKIFDIRNHWDSFSFFLSYFLYRHYTVHFLSLQEKSTNFIVKKI